MNPLMNTPRRRLAAGVIVAAISATGLQVAQADEQQPEPAAVPKGTVEHTIVDRVISGADDENGSHDRIATWSTAGKLLIRGHDEDHGGRLAWESLQTPADWKLWTLKDGYSVRPLGWGPGAAPSERANGIDAVRRLRRGTGVDTGMVTLDGRTLRRLERALPQGTVSDFADDVRSAEEVVLADPDTDQRVRSTITIDYREHRDFQQVETVLLDEDLPAADVTFAMSQGRR